MTFRPTNRPVSRRTALAGLGTGSLGLALATTARPSSAQESGGDLARHPLAGTWAVMTPGGIVPQHHGPDGAIVAYYAPNYVDPALGLTYQGPALGQWEADGERTGHFTFIQALSDAAGAYVGTFQLAADLEVSEDGQTWSGNTPPRLILRDAANNVTST